MENSLNLTLEQTIELANYYDVETEGRSMAAIEADIKSGIRAVKNGFVKIFQVIVGWCRAIKAKITKKDTVDIRPSVYNCGQRVITACKNLEKYGKKMAESGEGDDEKFNKLIKNVNDLRDEFNDTKSKAKDPGKVAKIPVVAAKVVNEIEELEKSANDALREAGTTSNFEKEAGFRGIAFACTTRKTVLQSYIGASN